MRWQKPLRYTIALAGVGFAALLYVRFQKKPDAKPAPLPPPMAKGATFTSAMSPGGEQVRYRADGTEVSRVGYTNMTQFDDGRKVIEHPRFFGDRDGKPFTVTADRGELRSPAGAKQNDLPEDTHLSGNVVMHEDNGIEITTDDAMYHESAALLDIPGPMTFTDGQTTGSGIGATYDRGQQLLTIKDQAVIHMAADSAGQGKFDATSKTMLVNRGTHLVSLDGTAQVKREHEVINANSLVMHLNDDNHGVQNMELRARSSIVPIGSTGAAPEMRADDINLTFQPDGRTIKRSELLRGASMVISGQAGRKRLAGDMLNVDLAADGQTVTHLFGNGAPLVMALPATSTTPQRTINGRTLDANLDDKAGQALATIKQSVRFEEVKPAERGQAASKRSVTAEQLLLYLNSGDLSDISEARFGTRVVFQDGTTSGTAEDMGYRAAESKLSLRSPATAAKPPSVKTDRIQVDAWILDIDLNKTIIDASEKLQTRTIPDKSKANKGLFDESKQTNGTGEKLHYDSEKHLATYTGGATQARLWQQGTGADLTRLDADSISIDDVKGDLHAEGKVTTQFRMDSMQTTAPAGSKAPPPTTTKSTAAKFDYIDAEKRAKYTGTATQPAVLDSSDGKISGATIELWLTDDGHDLKRMLVVGNVVARVSAERTVRADRMDYDVKTGLYKLSGNASKVIERSLDGTVESCNVTQGSDMTFTKTADGKKPGTFTISDAVGAGSRTARAKNCDDWRIK